MDNILDPADYEKFVLSIFNDLEFLVLRAKSAMTDDDLELLSTRLMELSDHLCAQLYRKRISFKDFDFLRDILKKE